MDAIMQLIFRGIHPILEGYAATVHKLLYRHRIISSWATCLMIVLVFFKFRL